MLSKPRTIFGIHEVTIYSRVDGTPYGTIRVIAGSSISLVGEVVELTGGSLAYPWDAQDGKTAAEMSFKPKEMPNWLFEVLLGKAPTETLNDTGSVSALTNVLNSSAQDATTGIASVGVKSGSEADIKFGKYVVKVVSPTTVDVYALSSVDFQRGTDKEYEDDLLKITASPLTITSPGVAVEVPDFGVELIGGSGAIAMTADDTAEFRADPPSTKKIEVDIGAVGDCVPEFGAIVTAQKQGDGSMWQFDVYRVKALGFPFGMEESAFNEAEITAKIMYDSDKNKVMTAYRLDPTTGCS